MKLLKYKMFVLLAFLTLGACGKNPGQEDRVKESLRESVLEKEATLTPLAGRYDGTLTSATGEIQQVVLQLIPTIIIVQNPGRNDVTEMPTLGGNINIYFSTDDRTDIIPVAQFTNAMFDPKTGHLRLNGSIQTGTSIGNVLNTLDGYVNGKKITGHLTNTSRGDLGLLEVTKVEATK